MYVTGHQSQLLFTTIQVKAAAGLCSHTASHTHQLNQENRRENRPKDVQRPQREHGLCQRRGDDPSRKLTRSSSRSDHKHFFYKFFRPHSGSPFGLPAPYPPPGAFTRPLPDSWGLPDSYWSKNQL